MHNNSLSGERGEICTLKEEMKSETRDFISTLEIVSYGDLLAIVPILPMIENKNAILGKKM